MTELAIYGDSISGNCYKLQLAWLDRVQSTAGFVDMKAPAQVLSFMAR